MQGQEGPGRHAVGEASVAAGGLDAMQRQLRGGLTSVGLFSLFINLLVLAVPLYMVQIFDRVGELPLEAEDKAFVFDALASPPSLQDIANLAEGPEQAAELYLASRLAIDPDHPMEQAYLEGLASRLSLPAELVTHLEGQAAAATA